MNYKNLICYLLALSFVFAVPHYAYAKQTEQCTVKMNGNKVATNPDGSYVDSDDFSTENKQLISKVVGQVADRLKDTSKSLYEKITKDSGFTGAVRAMIALYISIYGMLFMVGVVELKFHDFIMRMIKIGIIGILLSGSSWAFFHDTVITLFNDGSDQLINEITKIGVGGLDATPIESTDTERHKGAFDSLDKAISKAISSKMFVTLAASIPWNVYGLLFASMLLLSLTLFLKSILTAMFVYIMSLAMKTLLFGLAPVFIPMMLFERTKHLFQGWLNQVVNASLQPIMLFMFFTFFIHLMTTAMDQVLQTPVCWTKMPEGWRGSALDVYFWRFADVDGNGILKQHTGDVSTDAPFPIPIMAILTFLILAEIANRFNAVVIQIASQLAQTTTSLQGMESVFSGVVEGLQNKLGGGGAPSGVGTFGKNTAKGSAANK